MPDDKPLDPQAERTIARVRRLMAIAGATTFIALAAVLGVIGYRLFRLEGSARPSPDVSITLPAGARLLSTAIGEGHVALTIELNGSTEVRMFELETLKAVGTIKLETEP